MSPIAETVTLASVGVGVGVTVAADVVARGVAEGATVRAEVVSDQIPTPATTRRPARTATMVLRLARLSPRHLFPTIHSC